jgi:hypothetical protein
MWKKELFQKRAWFDDFNEKINQKLDELYSTVPDSGLSDREQYLYDMAQEQFKMLYELLDHSRELINVKLMPVESSAEMKSTEAKM